MMLTLNILCHFICISIVIVFIYLYGGFFDDPVPVKENSHEFHYFHAQYVVNNVDNIKLDTSYR